MTPYWPRANGEVERQNRSLLYKRQFVLHMWLGIVGDVNWTNIYWRTEVHRTVQRERRRLNWCSDVNCVQSYLNWRWVRIMMRTFVIEMQWPRIHRHSTTIRNIMRRPVTLLQVHQVLVRQLKENKSWTRSIECHSESRKSGYHSVAWWNSE